MNGIGVIWHENFSKVIEWAYKNDKGISCGANPKMEIDMLCEIIDSQYSELHITHARHASNASRIIALDALEKNYPRKGYFLLAKNRFTREVEKSPGGLFYRHNEYLFYVMGQ